MKQYPLAHLAAVVMLSCARSFKHCSYCFRTPLVRLLGPSFLLYIFSFPDSRCRPLVSLSDNLNPFQRCRGGKHKLCTYGAGMAKSRWAGTPSYPKTTDLSGSIFPRPCQKKKNRHSIHYSSSCRGKHLIGGIAMVIVKFRPRWPHTQRYALHSMSHFTMTSGRLG